MIVLFGRRIRMQEAQAEQLLIELEESRGAELRAAALAERQRLARDMHDVLAHSLSGLLLQLEGARLLAVSNPGDERLAGTIDRAHELARSGLDEARRAIGMLRDDELPGPDRLAALTATFQADTGVPARFTSSGTPQGAGLSGPARAVPGHPGGPDQRAQARPPRPASRSAWPTSRTSSPWRSRISPLPRPCPSEHPVAPPGGGYGLTGCGSGPSCSGGTLDAAPTDTGFLVQLRVPTGDRL